MSKGDFAPGWFKGSTGEADLSKCKTLDEEE